MKEHHQIWAVCASQRLSRHAEASSKEAAAWLHADETISDECWATSVICPGVDRPRSDAPPTSNEVHADQTILEATHAVA